MSSHTKTKAEQERAVQDIDKEIARLQEARALLVLIPRNKTPMGDPLRDFIESEKSEIMALSRQLFTHIKEAWSIGDRVAKLIGYDSLDEVEDQWEFMHFDEIYPNTTEVAIYEGFMAHAEGFREEWNKSFTEDE